MKKLLITGHLGLIGRGLTDLLKVKGFSVKGFDLADNSGDINNSLQLKKALIGCCGVVHLAAVSRVIWGQKDATKCWQTNAIASENLLTMASLSPLRPWVLVTSSREVYGEPESFPVNEDAPINPVNIYGQAKAYMEKKTLTIRQSGLNTAIVRLANVYGCKDDHHDRVLPAFCRHAATGSVLRVDGYDHVFDFTHVNDAVRGIAKMVDLLDAGERNLPPIHLLPGIGTTLKQAAEIAIRAAGTEAKIYEAESRQYDVRHFIGNPERARRLLGWEACIHPSEGIPALVQAFKEKLVSGVLV